MVVVVLLFGLLMRPVYNPARVRPHAKRFSRGLVFPVGFGSDLGLVARSYNRLSYEQLEAARKAVRRRLRREGRLSMVVAPVLPVTRKPLQSRMGRGKGRLSGRVAPVRPGQLLFRLSGVKNITRGRWALSAGRSRLPVAISVVLLSTLS